MRDREFSAIGSFTIGKHPARAARKSMAGLTQIEELIKLRAFDAVGERNFGENGRSAAGLTVYF